MTKGHENRSNSTRQRNRSVQHLFHGNIPGESEKGKQGEVYLAAEGKSSFLVRFRSPIHPSGQDSAYLSRSGVSQDGGCRVEVQTIQWCRVGGSKQPFGIGRSGIRQVEGSSSPADVRSHGRLQRTEREDMGTLLLARRNLARNRGAGFTLPCTSLSDGGAVLPAALPVPRHAEGTFAQTELPHDGG